MKNNTSLTNVVQQAEAGDKAAALMLAYAFTGIISAALPCFGLGFFSCKRRNDYRDLRWNNFDGDEVARVSLIGGGAIDFRIYDHDGDRWGGTTFPNIDNMIYHLRRVGEGTTAKKAPRTSRRRREIHRSRKANK